jgi:hypothetical protein
MSATNIPILVSVDDMINSGLTDRTKRIKDARTEAQKEIEEYRKQKEEEFKKFEAEVGSMSSTNLFPRSIPCL